MGLRDSLKPDQAEVLGEVLNDALEQARETLRLHEADDLGWYQKSLSVTAEVYLEMIAIQNRRIAIIEELIGMVGK